NSQGLLTAEIDLSWTGDIYVRDNQGSGVQWYDTGSNWVIGSYKTVSIEVDATANTIKYYYDASLIYTGVVWAGTSVEQAIFFDDNYNVSDVGDYDNLAIQFLS